MVRTHRIVQGTIVGIASMSLLVGLSSVVRSGGKTRPASFDEVIRQNATQSLEHGRQTFRRDTFGDEAFWGDLLRLHEAIAGAARGGQGPGLSPRNALQLGLKVDSDALSSHQLDQIRRGKIDLDDPAVTLALLKQNAVVGLTGFFSGDRLRSVGIQCALCHSTVDNAVAPGVGHRLDGWANQDLNVGAIVALAPNLQPFATLLGVDVATVKTVLQSWGPGKFDAELILDGKAFRPDGKSAATLIPPAFGLAGVNLHTWTGWGSVTHWNAFVSNLEMHGLGTFFDPRLDDAARFPIAAREGFGHVRNRPDRITSKLADLHFYQLAIPAPRPPDGSFDAVRAEQGDRLFEGKARCATCHVPPLYTEPGWNLHTPAEIGIDDFQAERAPDRRYRTSPLKGLWTHTKRGFYHDGRFPTLLDVVNHYDGFFSLGLSEDEKLAVVEYLKSLGDDAPSPVQDAVKLNADVEMLESGPSEGVEAKAARIWPTPLASGQTLHLRLGSAWRAADGMPRDLEVALYDVSGRRVSTMSVADVGSGELTWSGRDTRGMTAAPGVYFVRARARSIGLTLERRIVVR